MDMTSDDEKRIDSIVNMMLVEGIAVNREYVERAFKYGDSINTARGLSVFLEGIPELENFKDIIESYYDSSDEPGLPCEIDCLLKILGKPRMSTMSSLTAYINDNRQEFTQKAISNAIGLDEPGDCIVNIIPLAITGYDMDLLTSVYNHHYNGYIGNICKQGMIECLENFEEDKVSISDQEELKWLLDNADGVMDDAIIVDRNIVNMMTNSMISITFERGGGDPLLESEIETGFIPSLSTMLDSAAQAHDISYYKAAIIAYIVCTNWYKSDAECINTGEFLEIIDFTIDNIDKPKEFLDESLQVMFNSLTNGK